MHPTLVILLEASTDYGAKIGICLEYEEVMDMFPNKREKPILSANIYSLPEAVQLPLFPLGRDQFYRLQIFSGYFILWAPVSSLHLYLYVSNSW